MADDILPIDYTSFDVRQRILDGRQVSTVQPKEYAERLLAACTLLLKTQEELLNSDGTPVLDAEGNQIYEKVENNFADAYETIVPINGRLSPRYVPAYWALNHGMSDTIRACNNLNKAIWGEGWIYGRNVNDPRLRRFSRR